MSEKTGNNAHAGKTLDAAEFEVPLDEVQIGPLYKKETPQVVKILSSAFNKAATLVREALADSFAADQPPITFVASIHDKVIGVIRCVNYPEQPLPTYSIYQLAVDPAFRQHGIGHALTGHVEDYIAQGLASGQQARITLVDETKKENPSSAFYENMGYRPEQKPRTNKEGLPVLVKYVDKKTDVKQKSAPSPKN